MLPPRRMEQPALAKMHAKAFVTRNPGIGTPRPSPVQHASKTHPPEQVESGIKGDIRKPVEESCMDEHG